MNPAILNRPSSQTCNLSTTFYAPPPGRITNGGPLSQKRGPGRPRIRPRRLSSGIAGRPKGRRDSYPCLEKSLRASLSKEELDQKIEKRKSLLELVNMKKRPRLDADTTKGESCWDDRLYCPSSDQPCQREVSQPYGSPTPPTEMDTGVPVAATFPLEYHVERVGLTTSRSRPTSYRRFHRTVTFSSIG